MRKVFPVLLLLLFGPMTISAQEADTPFRRSFSVEAGTGFSPFHTMVAQNGLRRDLARSGMAPVSKSVFYPNMSLSVVWRVSERWEAVAVGGLSWCSYQAVQYQTFGTDPYGQPRYDLDHSSPIGRRSSYYMGSLSAVARVLLNPQQKVVCYGAFGLGVVAPNAFFPVLPTITPIGARAGFKHLYFFAEITFSPVASLLHGGLGWHF